MSDFLTAEDMAIVVEFGLAGQSVVKGLDNIGLPGLSREIATVKEFREAISRQFTTGATLGNINFSGTYVKQDFAGYNKLVEYFIANTKVTTMRVYLNKNDFLAVDIANDASSAMQVSELMKPDADSNGVIPMSGIIVLNGRPATFFAHNQDFDGVLGANCSCVAGSGTEDTIVSASALVQDFDALGFKIGQSIAIENSVSNDAVTGIITAVTSTIITLDGEGVVTDETFPADCIISGGALN